MLKLNKFMWQNLKNVYHLLQAFVAALYFGFPSNNLIVIGVTGTDGKTTTCHMIYEILKSQGIKTSMISSVSAVISGITYDTGFHVTTPSPWQVQKLLKLAKNKGSKYFVLEATSHGLDQNRLAFVKFKAAVLTNITNEHLDYHETIENYTHAKAKLFKNVEFSILNKDDASFTLLKNLADGKIISYGKDTELSKKNYPLKLKVVSGFNIQNAQAAAATAAAIGIKKNKIIKALSNFGGVKGRMQKVSLGQNFQVFVDFAHTPNALKYALTTLKSQKGSAKSKIIAVFGAAGERDKTKRAEMGKVVARLADIAVITAEDPRHEKIEDISNDIAMGFKKERRREGRDFYLIPDRRKAINFAVDVANKNDIVAFFGKGHEKSMTYGKKELPWDELYEVEKAIQKKLNQRK